MRTVNIDCKREFGAPPFSEICRIYAQNTIFAHRRHIKVFIVIIL